MKKAAFLLALMAIMAMQLAAQCVDQKKGKATLTTAYSGALTYQVCNDPGVKLVELYGDVTMPAAVPWAPDLGVLTTLPAPARPKTVKIIPAIITVDPGMAQGKPTSVSVDPDGTVRVMYFSAGVGFPYLLVPGETVHLSVSYRK
jgi:hypothetical protein